MGQWTGIRRHGAGWQAWVSVKRARDSKVFPLDATPDEIQAWREQRRAELVLSTGAAPVKGSFADDAIRYLKSVRAMPTYAQRRQHIREWVAVFGAMRRGKITSADIRRQRDHWLTAPRVVTRLRHGQMITETKPPYASNSVSQRLRALSNLWTVLDGRRAPNPVREVPEPQDRDLPPRAIPYPLIERILNALPDRGRASKGQSRPTASQTKARLLIMAWTGLPPKAIGQIQASDVDFAAGTVRVAGRKKGKGAKGAILPLLPEAVAAFRLLDQTGAWGPYSRHSARQSFKRACAKVKGELLATGLAAPDVALLDVLTPYDLRHSFATAGLQQTGNLRGVQKLLLHGDIRTTLRYTEAAVDPLALAVLASFRPLAERQSGTPAEQSADDARPNIRRIK